MNWFKRYRLPIIVSVMLFVGCAILGSLPSTRAKFAKKVVEEEEVEITPRGNVLNVVVDVEGAYLGSSFVPLERFGEVITNEYKDKKVAYFIVEATETVRYGSVVQVFISAHQILNVPGTIATIAIAPGLRRPAIQVYSNSCDAPLVLAEDGSGISERLPPEAKEEDNEANQALVPTSASVTPAADASVAPAAAAAHL